MAKLVEISKHSDYKLLVKIDRGTVYFLNKGNSTVHSESDTIIIEDDLRTLSFPSVDVLTPSGNTTLEIVTGIQKVIES